ncbi:MAG: hypothetical protein CL489_05960 [Acidobacteria bacterium]|nr:hypothetical protein [Acidobacteriota bacterium]
MNEPRGRGRPKGAPNKPLMKLVTERKRLTNDADVYEILCQADIVAQEDVDKAAHGLRVFGARNAAVLKVLKWVFLDSIQSTLPEGATPFNKNDAPESDLAETSLRFEHKMFKYFVTEEVPQTRRETMWIELLEGIPSEEAQMMDLIKDGKFPFKNITAKVAQVAFPDEPF